MIWIATAGLFATITITIAMPMKTSKIGKNKRPAFSGTVHKETYQTLPDNMNEPDWGCVRDVREEMRNQRVSPARIGYEVDSRMKEQIEQYVSLKSLSSETQSAVVMWWVSPAGYRGRHQQVRKTVFPLKN